MSNGLASGMNYILTRLNSAAGYLAAFIIFGLMLYNSYATVSRRFFHAPVPGVTEISSTLLPVMAFLAMAWDLEVGRHINIDLLVKRFGTQAQRIIRFVTSLFVLAFSVVAVWKGTELSIDKLHDLLEAPGVRIPIFPFYVIVPIGGLLLLLQTVKNMRSYYLSMMRRAPVPEEEGHSPHAPAQKSTET
ncbi:MAG: TRAP transporter small permease [Chloroflexi bacterium]|nr:TRAP transporter small permease [Chloroflexota bacterium]